MTTALSVLDLVREMGPGTTATDIATRLTLSRSTTYRIIALLVRENYLVRDADGGIALGPKAVSLGQPALAFRTSQAVRSELGALRGKLGIPVHLIAYGNRSAHVVDEDPTSPLPLQIKAARHLSCTPCGILLIAQLARSRPNLSALIAEGGQDPRTLDSDVWSVLESAVTLGYLQGSWLSTKREIVAVPIRNAEHDPAGALVVWPSDSPPRRTGAVPSECVPALMESGQQLSVLMA